MWYSSSPLGKCSQPEPPHCPLISNGSSLSLAHIIAHRLKFCSFSFQFTSFAGRALPATWRPGLVRSCGHERGCFCGGHWSLSVAHFPSFWRVSGEQLDLMGQCEQAPPFSGGEAMEPSITDWPLIQTAQPQLGSTELETELCLMPH